MAKQRYHLIRNRLSRLNNLELASLTQICLSKLTGNLHFPNPTPSLLVLENALNEFKEWYTKALSGDRNAIAKRDTKRGVLEELMRQLTAYVQNISNGDAALILSSGMDMRSPSGPSQPLEPPTAIQAKALTITTTIQVQCKRQKNARYWILEYCKAEDYNNGKYTHSQISTTSKVVLRGLEPYQEYYFRMAVGNSVGQSDWSNIVSARPV